MFEVAHIYLQQINVEISDYYGIRISFTYSRQNWVQFISELINVYFYCCYPLEVYMYRQMLYRYYEHFL